MPDPRAWTQTRPPARPPATRDDGDPTAPEAPPEPVGIDIALPETAATTPITGELKAQTTDLSFYYGTHQALKRVSIAFQEHAVTAIIGPSGCGKSTLLRLVSGLDRATAGTVNVAPCRLGYVFQDPTLLPWRNVRRNVELPAELRGLPRVERRRRAAEAIALVGLEEFARHRPRTLSGGMRMRVSLARALTMSPSLFLFDEPFGALDAISRERLGDELQALYADRRFAAVYVTHAVSEAICLSSRVLVMGARGGDIVADVPVPLPFPRPPEARYASELAGIAAEVHAHLRSGSADPAPDAVAARSEEAR
jgi:NitT/TauT family transport system ATP-binding protein